MLFSKTLGLLPFVAMALAGASKFANTCQDIDGEGTTLHAQCRDRENGQLQSTALDLNRCLKNDKGKLKCGKNGNYSGSCINCAMRGTADFSCQCRNSEDDHRYVHTVIDLSEFKFLHDLLPPHRNPQGLELTHVPLRQMCCQQPRRPWLLDCKLLDRANERT
ncbi:unnamed protein product [Penicillium salamii]|nr:unnamed protein product [Penicillium salamii]CAG8408840.1 unnamed protein product [Penicillium salamii]